MSTLLKKHDFDPVFDSQKIFRCLLEALSNPGRTVDIRETAVKFSGENTELMAIALSLLDNEVSFCVCGDERLRTEIAALTLAPVAAADTAAFIFVEDIGQLEQAIAAARVGTPADPHSGATVIVKISAEATERLTIAGPGIAGEQEVEAPAVVGTALNFREDKACEYPEGIELIFVAATGSLLAIPRTTRIGRKEKGR